MHNHLAQPHVTGFRRSEFSRRAEELSATVQSQTSCWIRPLRCVPEARFRLFCFPYAGGSAAVFRDWPEFFQPAIETCAIHLPGRGNRLCEKPHFRIGPVVKAVCATLQSEWSGKPFALFGHSMGALIAFEVARQMEAQGGPRPAHLFVSGCRAPSLLDASESRHNLPVRELLNYLRELGGTPDEVFENEELLECFLPSIRADLELVETYQYSPFPALLRCPITALGGVDDQEADPDSLMAWREESSESFLLKMFPRGHFFIDGAQAAVAEIILGALGLERYP